MKLWMDKHIQSWIFVDLHQIQGIPKKGGLANATVFALLVV